MYKNNSNLEAQNHFVAGHAHDKHAPGRVHHPHKDGKGNDVENDGQSRIGLGNLRRILAVLDRRHADTGQHRRQKDQDEDPEND